MTEQPGPEILGFKTATIAVRDAEESAARVAAAFGLPVPEIEWERTPGIEAGFARFALGDQRYVLMQDTSGKGPVGRFIERRGEGLFSLCVQVSDMKAMIAQMQAAGVEFVEPEPRRVTKEDGSEGLIAWTRPQTFNGVLIELQQAL